MCAAPNVSRQIEQYRALLATRETRALSADETQRLDLLRDILLEAQVALDVEEGFPRRAPRAPMKLDVGFSTSGDAARAFSTTRDIGTGGISFVTDVPMEKGTVLTLAIAVPGWAVPLRAEATVAWCREGVVGLAFSKLTPELEKQIKALITENSSFLDRLARPFAPRREPVRAAVKERLTVVLVRLRDEALTEGIIQGAGAQGYCALTRPADTPPSIIVGDSSSALEVTEKHPGVPLILVNISGPESLVGRLSRVVPAAFVPRPATVERVVSEVARVVAGPSAGAR